VKILVIGSGGREHAIIKTLNKNRKISKIFAAPGNGGISRDAECVPIKAVDIQKMTDFAINNKIDYVVVTPDDPLALGMVDALEQKGIRCFGTKKAAAQIESSKIFAKNLMKKYGIPTAAYEIFTDADKAQKYVKSKEIAFPIVIKADGLALGKGVIIAENCEQAMDAITSVMVDKIFGESGSSIVIEEFLTGPEVSVLAFTDGKTIVPMISSMDHKRAFDGNTGPNTGGMGAIAPNPHYTDKIARQCEKTIYLQTIRAMREEGCPFKGCLFFGLMLTPRGPSVIEYNCRFGDPETQAVLPLLETDLLEIMESISDEKLDSINIRWKDAFTACVVLSSGGYPVSYETGFEIGGINNEGNIKDSDSLIFHAGTKYKDGKFYTAGGRVLGVTAVSDTPDAAIDKSYRTADKISYNKMFYRKDIGKY